MKMLLPAIGLILILAGTGCDSTDDVVAVDQTQVPVSTAPLQCGNNAWDQAGKSVEEYFEELGVRVHQVSTMAFQVNVCESCACVEGKRIDVVVDSEWVGFMESEGFYRYEDWPYDWGTI